MASVQAPADRTHFHFAIICALRCEFDAILLLVDQFWDEESDPYGRAGGDHNHYTTGRIENHNVVLVLLPGIGSNSAAAAASSLRSSYPNIKLAILVGICGGIPHIEGHDTLLGDVVVSTTIIQYDNGRQYPGQFVPRRTIEDSLGRANSDIRGLLEGCQTHRAMKWLQRKASEYLRYLQDAAIKEQYPADYRYPGMSQNTLYPPTYIHKHRDTCALCATDAFCESASKALCGETKCDSSEIVARDRVMENDIFSPKIFIGRVGSGNTVMKSGEDRDRIAADHNIIAFEMEGAGAWDEVPSIVVKGISDYADSHKNKEWQNFAAATSACVAKAILKRYPISDPQGASAQNQPSTSSSLFGNGTSINQVNIVQTARSSPGEEDWPSASEEEYLSTDEEDWADIIERRKNRCGNCGYKSHGEEDCRPECGRCSRMGHTQSECGYRVRCINCKRDGHVAKRCPRRWRG